MTDTPRTDRAISDGYRFTTDDGVREYVPADFARQLERELAAMTARADRAERAERDLREEVSSTFRKYGLAAGPRAVEALIEERDKAVARALRAEAIEREVCEGRHVYLQQEMDEVAQRALKAEEARDAAERELSVLRLCYSRAVDPGEHEALAARNAMLIEALKDAAKQLRHAGIFDGKISSIISTDDQL
jgi:hypothetical protein